MDDNSTSPIGVICGPTGAGKTFLATWFSRMADVTVVSADSRQLYTGFDIGTAKPTVAERHAANVLDAVDDPDRFRLRVVECQGKQVTAFPYLVTGRDHRLLESLIGRYSLGH